MSKQTWCNKIIGFSSENFQRADNSAIQGYKLQIAKQTEKLEKFFVTFTNCSELESKSDQTLYKFMLEYFEELYDLNRVADYYMERK